jgi:hypothetical protein
MFIQIKVSSVAGNETRSAKLSVVELPFAPTNVQAKRLGEPNQRIVGLSWTPGFDGNSPILKYIVQRREVSEIEISGPLPDNLQNWITEVSNISASVKSVSIKNLKAATSYQFRISAVNRVGEGYPSEPTNTISLPHEGYFTKLSTFVRLFRFNFNSQHLPVLLFPSWVQHVRLRKLLHNGSHHSKNIGTVKYWDIFCATNSVATIRVRGLT